MIHAAVEVIEPGDILVVATTAPSTNGMFGELLATSVMARGCAGVVVDAGVRDISDLRRLGLPVWSRAIHASGTVKATPGSVNVPIVCGGATVGPGDVVVADDDGVVVVERERAVEVLEVARERLERETEVRARLAAGELGVDFYGFRERLEGYGSPLDRHPRIVISDFGLAQLEALDLARGRPWEVFDVFDDMGELVALQFGLAPTFEARRRGHRRR